MLFAPPQVGNFAVRIDRSICTHEQGVRHSGQDKPTRRKGDVPSRRESVRNLRVNTFGACSIEPAQSADERSINAGSPGQRPGKRIEKPTDRDADRAAYPGREEPLMIQAINVPQEPPAPKLPDHWPAPPPLPSEPPYQPPTPEPSEPQVPEILPPDEPIEPE